MRSLTRARAFPASRRRVQTVMHFTNVHGDVERARVRDSTERRPYRGRKGAEVVVESQDCESERIYLAQKERQQSPATSSHAQV